MSKLMVLVIFFTLEPVLTYKNSKINKLLFYLSRSIREQNKKKNYFRKDWKHWIDQNKDCQNTRQEVLIRDSKIPPILSKNSCKVLYGYWEDPYSGEIFKNPQKLDIDHMVPLKEAHISGGWNWDKKKKKKFANDLLNPNHLVVVKASVNRSKGAKDPSEWMPPNKKNHCKYIKSWMRIKKNYNLFFDKKEARFIRSFTRKCKL